MDRVSVGMHVDIRRSDGRVHNAVISEVRKETQSVTVEWFENGETKGKEVDLNTLLTINPTLASHPSTSIYGLSNGDGNATTNKVQMRHSLASNGSFGSRRSMYTPQLMNLTLSNDPGNETTHRPVNGLTRQSLADETIRVEPVKAGQQAPVKSSTVQEIERLQKNREERRAQQEEAKKQKELMRNIDPGNPNWQFLSMIRDYQSRLDFRPLKITDQVADKKICVCVRKRPLNRAELRKKEIEVITIPNRDHVIVLQPQVKVDLTKYLEDQKFRFDYAFDENASNEMVYRFTAQPLVRTIFEKGFATCFAYGQTGSGKTHTMGGTFSGKSQDCSKGIYALTARDVFKMLNKDYRKERLDVFCSFFEIYGGKVFDLIDNKTMLRVLEDGKKEVQVVGLQEIPVANERQVLDLIKKGTDIRTAGTTSANANSSRSHAVFQIILRKKGIKDGPGRLWGKFSLIDLAGNERGVDTISSDRQTRLEGAEINKSLLALKECIRAMGRNSSHVPFRASKLTLVLRDSFIGSNARTCMIAMISPGMGSCEHTLNTLRYADRVKELGADDGSNPPMEDDELMLSNEEDDFDLVHQRNGLNEEDYKIQATMSGLIKAEERVVDDISSVAEECDKWKMEAVSLLKRPSSIDYDMDAFVNDAMQFATLKRDKFIRLCSHLEKMQAELNRDAEASSRIFAENIDFFCKLESRDSRVVGILCRNFCKAYMGDGKKVVHRSLGADLEVR
uniref:Kinesin-like protein n=1 Tax=Syphacia muris TaxID=451379 RepID=A0A0N5AF57_9BILA